MFQVPRAPQVQSGTFALAPVPSFDTVSPEADGRVPEHLAATFDIATGKAKLLTSDEVSEKFKEPRSERL
eukprot:14445308-Alexandrium_andersonii.AAC.1